MIVALTVLFFIIAVLLVAVVLLQSGGAGGIGFIGGGGSQSAFGTKTGNVMTRLTTTLAALFLMVSFVLGYLNARQERIDIKELEELQESVDTGREPSEEPLSGVGEDIGVDITR